MIEDDEDAFADIAERELLGRVVQPALIWGFPVDIWEAAKRASMWAEVLYLKKITASERREVVEAIANEIWQERVSRKPKAGETGK